MHPDRHVGGVFVAVFLTIPIAVACPGFSPAEEYLCDERSPCPEGRICRLESGACAPAGCGDGVCLEDECETCPVDCAESQVCVPTEGCGDGVCLEDECETCPVDCAESQVCLPPVCGDRICEPGKGECLTCIFDCGPRDCGTCGDGVCEIELGECRFCPEDCTADDCNPNCGDGHCEVARGECELCEGECGGWECNACDDATCTIEDCDYCPSDCRDVEGACE